MEALKISHLTKAFGNLRAVDDLSFSVAEGEIFGLVGPDGAGKTTTLRLLTATLDPTSGDAWVLGRHSVREAEAIKEEIGYMSQRFGLYSDLTVVENIHFYADIYGVPRRGRDLKIDQLLAFSNLTPFKKRLAGNLSGGMKQKLGLACALIHTPKVLFLDEPTNGVDPVSRRDFWRILYQLLREKVTILVSTAYLDEAERCNRVGLLHKGQLLAIGTPDEVKKLMRGRILEVRASEPRRAATLLREQLRAESVGLFGDRVHVVTQEPEKAAAQVKTVLAGAGLELTGLRSAEPALEDVFISILAGEKAAGRTGTPSPRPPVSPSPLPAHRKAVLVKDLEKRFGSFIAVNRISFEVAAGEIFGFLGPNGAGKSTTIRMLCGILAPTAGEGTVAGFDIRREAEKIKAHIGYMSQKFSLYEDLTVEENIDFYSGIYRIAPEKKKGRKEWVIEMAGLKEHRHSRTATLSGGWKQRLALGCAILHEPPILFLDEPTSGVDPISRRQFWDLIYELSGKGVTVFVTTHHMDEAEYCDRLGLIYRGELIATGTPEALKTELMREDILEVLCERPQDAMGELEKIAGVQEVALFGMGLHVVVEEGPAALPLVRKLLDERGYAVRQIEKITPSLEDVFVSLIEARDRVEQPQQKEHGALEVESGGQRKEDRERSFAFRLPLSRGLLRVWAVTRKEFIHIFRDPWSIGIAIAMPMLMLVLYGYALTFDVDNVPLVVWDQSESQTSRELISHFQGSRYFSLRGQVRNYRELERAIDSGQALVGLVIPRDFAGRVESGRSAQVQLIVDGSDSNTATIAMGYADALVQIYSQQATLREVRQAGGRVQPQPVEVRPRAWFNPDMESKNYIIPGLVAVIMMVIAAMLTSLTVAREWERGTMEPLISTPIKGPELILGKLLPYFMVGLLDVSLAVLMGEFLFQVPLRGNLALLFSMAAIFLAGALSLGLVISIVAKNQLLASQLAMVMTFLPSYLLSGFMSPIQNIPRPLQLITYVIPARYFVTLLKSIYLKGLGLEILAVEAGLLTAFAGVMVLLAHIKFKKKLE